MLLHVKICIILYPQPKHLLCHSEISVSMENTHFLYLNFKFVLVYYHEEMNLTCSSNKVTAIIRSTQASFMFYYYFYSIAVSFGLVLLAVVQNGNLLSSHDISHMGLNLLPPVCSVLLILLPHLFYVLYNIIDDKFLLLSVTGLSSLNVPLSPSVHLT